MNRGKEQTAVESGRVPSSCIALTYEFPENIQIFIAENHKHYANAITGTFLVTVVDEAFWENFRVDNFPHRQKVLLLIIIAEAL